MPESIVLRPLSHFSRLINMFFVSCSPESDKRGQPDSADSAHWLHPESALSHIKQQPPILANVIRLILQKNIKIT